ncbi:enoyl-CoA hydratase/isomerase family protein [Desulfosarcina sp. OttesenSCG-928-A07]|nr:enoyl-CoA hydratase/isomerase family protein [Desulfosarcina sp. OttesenSCG-928-G17]MDL2328978.1 enoyl-CoA hydratase/isomerase family protein [Desulfosarcina sp. OttesenSCG-928-A07]
MPFKTIVVDKKDQIATVTLNLPEKLNALDLVMREELKVAFLEFSKAVDVKAVVITGAGRAFCAGGDITTMQTVTAPAGRDRLKNVQQLVRALTTLEKPVIAAVNGPAIGAGFNIALACDMILASEKAKFSQSFVKIGLIPDMGGFYLLPMRIGVHRAKDLMMTGRTIDAKEAESMGLINRLVASEVLMDEAVTVAKTMAGGASRALSMIKSALNRWPTDLETFLEIEANMQAVCFETRDFKEGMRAFLEKRPPVFTGE